MDETREREAQRRLVARMAASLNTDLTGLAKKAGLVPTTLTRFVNGHDVKHLLSHRTLAKLSAVSAVPLPGTTDPAILARLGHRMRLVRQAMAPTLDDETVAAACGWTPQEMAEVFAGRKEPSVGSFAAFTKRMRVTADLLLFGDPEGLTRRAVLRLQAACREILEENPEDSGERTDTAPA